MYYQEQLHEKQHFFDGRKSNKPDSLDKWLVNFHQLQIY
jgi:hypothetical protein